ncbi:nitroreductase family deazaflavin-dependent oxidoreductase [Agrococcus baldri]|uniref:Deazaflavin-dependent oxidoreductase, nitroreductase family n=1 Tax=Agrococcus baldri TaxID=153730 RepID=A0AA87RFU9_9MICO|nr:nitroreductase family deazaflavin-dependent oxidoreductase [Agrococcus baldri]GEK79751.1 hypothetical protein ABA31_11020 [Agrococcus baldri]
MMNGMRRAWLWLLKHTLNRATGRAARTPGGPFSLVRHVGRKSGKAFAHHRRPGRRGLRLRAHLRRGRHWYRNIVAAGGCVLVVDGVEHEIVAVEPYGTDAGLRAFGGAKAVLLRLLRRREFRLLRTAA